MEAIHKGILFETTRRRSLDAATLANPWRLTRAEYEIVRLICQGLSSSEIAQTLYVSPRTLQTHVRAILRKLGVYDRVGVILAVLEHPAARRRCFPHLTIDGGDTCSSS